MAELRLGSLNYIVLLGRVTLDPDLRYTPSGAAVLGFRIAVNRRYKDKSGEWKEDTSYFPVNIWGQAAERLSEQMKRGSAVLVEGQLRSRDWETKAGEKRTSIEIWSSRTQVLDKLGAPPEGGRPAKSSDTNEDEPDTPRDQLDDIPF
jgi:single-strand DNA-binding protein